MWKKRRRCSLAIVSAVATLISCLCLHADEIVLEIGPEPSGGTRSVVDYMAESSEFPSIDRLPEGSGVSTGICDIFGLRVRCRNQSGEQLYADPVPIIPGELYLAINPESGGVYDPDTFRRDVEVVLTHDQGLPISFSPFEYGWANFHSGFWLNATEDPSGALLYELWSKILTAHNASDQDMSGSFIASVFDDGQLHSKQICWLYFDAEDPISPKCTAIIKFVDGVPYVRFHTSLYEGGYMFEPEYEVACLRNTEQAQDNQTLKAWATELIGSPPFGAMLHSERGRGADAFELQFRKVAEPSFIFPGYRELLDVRLDVRYFEDEILKSIASGVVIPAESYFIEINFSLAITKQNIGDLSKLLLPSETQAVYFGEELYDAFVSSGCVPI